MQTHNTTDRFRDLMTEDEVIDFLRIPEVSNGADPHNVIDNLRRQRGLPCLHISRQPLYYRPAIRRWLRAEIEKEA